MNERTPWLAIGRLGKPKGLKGELFFDLYNPASEALDRADSVRVGDRELRVDRFLKLPKRNAILFEGIGSVDEARALTGCEVEIRKSDLPELRVGEHYVVDLIGMKVTDPDGRELGVLTDVLPTASNDIYVVRGEGGEILLPALPGVIRRVDREAGVIVANPPEAVDAF